jgi:hypothetical protein
MTSTPEQVEQAERALHTSKVAVIAHAIRLGKPLQPGDVANAALALESIKDGVSQGKRPIAGRLTFLVTQALIAEAKEMINSQRAQYREPKTTVVVFDPTRK